MVKKVSKRTKRELLELIESMEYNTTPLRTEDIRKYFVDFVYDRLLEIQQLKIGSDTIKNTTNNTINNTIKLDVTSDVTKKEQRILDLLKEKPLRFKDIRNIIFGDNKKFDGHTWSYLKSLQTKNLIEKKVLSRKKVFYWIK